MKIIVDSREQTPFVFEDYDVKKLDAGDYSVEGYEDEVAVERKGVNDAINSVFAGRERFEKEWLRAKSLKRFFVVIEGIQDSIQDEIIEHCQGDGSYVARNTKSVINTYLHWCVKYNIPVFFCHGREEAKRTTYELLRAYVNYIESGKISLDEMELEKKFL
jgi:ERCC4-type nuclease